MSMQREVVLRLRAARRVVLAIGPLIARSTDSAARCSGEVIRQYLLQLVLVVGVGRKRQASIGCQTEPVCSEVGLKVQTEGQPAANNDTTPAQSSGRRVVSRQSSLRRSSPESAGVGAQQRKEREILCVDDDKLQLLLLKRFICQSGLKCTTVGSAEEALALLERRATESGVSSFPEQIILDIYLPGLNGIETMQLIHEGYPNVIMPVTLCSSEHEDVLRGVRIQDTATSYLFKPFSRETLMACIFNQARVIELQRRSRLLGAILPSSVISRLHLSAPRIIADYLPASTVLFSDIVGYTSQAAAHSTPDVMGVLHEMFSYFDLLTDLHGVLKVETIGASCRPSIADRLMLTFRSHRLLRCVSFRLHPCLARFHRLRLKVGMSLCGYQ